MYLADFHFPHFVDVCTWTTVCVFRCIYVHVCVCGMVVPKDNMVMVKYVIWFMLSCAVPCSIVIKMTSMRCSMVGLALVYKGKLFHEVASITRQFRIHSRHWKSWQHLHWRNATKQDATDFTTLYTSAIAPYRISASLQSRCWNRLPQPAVWRFGTDTRASRWRGYRGRGYKGTTPRIFERPLRVLVNRRQSH